MHAKEYTTEYDSYHKYGSNARCINYTSIAMIKTSKPKQLIADIWACKSRLESMIVEWRQQATDTVAGAES